MMVIRFFILIFLFSNAAVQTYAQANLLFDATFNACDAFDEAGAIMGEAFGNPGCVCGADDMGFFFDGADDSLSFDSGIEEILNQDFALSFYFFIQNDPNANQAIDLISYGSQCRRDSSLTIRYIPQSQEIRAEMAINSPIRFTTRGVVPTTSCIHHLVFNKNDDRLELYIDDILVDQLLEFEGSFQVKPDAKFTVGASPCAGGNTQLFRGIIDDIKFFDRPLLENEVIALNARPDRITTPDQTIFLGESVTITTGQLCSNFFSWSPTDDLTDELTVSPTASPEETTSYGLTVDYGTCISQDSVRISVVDRENSSCGDLLLPSAFTPNNDKRNDLFGISNTFIIDQLISFDIYSRWGEHLFSAESELSQGWDGNYKGEQMNPGTLLYTVVYVCGGEEFKKSGSFVLLR